MVVQRHLLRTRSILSALRLSRSCSKMARATPRRSKAGSTSTVSSTASGSGRPNSLYWTADGQDFPFPHHLA